LLFFLQIGLGRKGGAVAKQTPMMEMTRRYGHTLYSISAFSNPDSSSTYEEKLLQLIRHEMVKLPAGTQYNEQMNDCAAQSASC